MITLKAYPFITHKKAENSDDCQDAVKVNEDAARYAVADGATRSFFPKQWAELLVNHFCETSNLVLSRENWKEWLVPIQEEWYKRVEERVKERNQFYLTNSFNTREPAVSTFIGLEVDKTKLEWQAVIIGDSCLFHKSKAGFESYPIKKSEDFTSRPEVFASFAEGNHYDPEFIDGEVKPGDIFILATDALAKWILEYKESENLGEILNQFRRIEDNQSFGQFVRQARDNEDIRLVNDDVTLMLILVEESKSSKIEEDDQKDPSEIQTSKDVEEQISILEVIFWVLLAGGFSFLTFRWVYRFLRDLIFTFIPKN